MVSGWQSCTCGRYGSYFTKGPSTRIPKCGNAEICYKLCKDIYPCKAWTFDLNDHSCTLYNYENAVTKSTKKCIWFVCSNLDVKITSYTPYDLSRFGYASMGYNTNTNAKISGPRTCPGRWENGLIF